MGKFAIDFCELHIRHSVRKELKKAKMEVFVGVMQACCMDPLFVFLFFFFD